MTQWGNHPQARTEVWTSTASHVYWMGWRPTCNPRMWEGIPEAGWIDRFDKWMALRFKWETLPQLIKMGNDPGWYSRYSLNISPTHTLIYIYIYIYHTYICIYTHNTYTYIWYISYHIHTNTKHPLSLIKSCFIICRWGKQAKVLIIREFHLFIHYLFPHS